MSPRLALTKTPVLGGLCPGACGEEGGRGEAGQGEHGQGGWLKGLSCPHEAARHLTGSSCLQEYGLPFMETSAKMGLNVDLAFTAIAK